MQTTTVLHAEGGCKRFSPTKEKMGASKFGYSFPSSDSLLPVYPCTLKSILSLPQRSIKQTLQWEEHSWMHRMCRLWFKFCGLNQKGPFTGMCGKAMKQHPAPNSALKQDTSWIIGQSRYQGYKSSPAVVGHKAKLVYASGTTTSIILQRI